MKKIILLSLVVLFVLMSVIAVSAFDQNGNDTWCTSDADGCWVTGEAGEKVYIMFWTEASREKFMGRGSSAPLGTLAAPGKVFLPRPDKGGSCLSGEELFACFFGCFDEAGSFEDPECLDDEGDIDVEKCLGKTEGLGSCIESCIANTCDWVWDDIN